MLDALLAEARLRWGFDPAAGVQVVAAERLVATPVGPSRPLLIVPAAALGPAPAGVDGSSDAPSALPGRHGPGGDTAIGVLSRLYPAEHPVGRFGVAETGSIGALTEADMRGPLYLPPLAPQAAVADPWALPWISHRLRQPDGCPWDREQTHQSLRSHLLEEAYEVYDALEAGATPELAGELGDLLLQVILHAQLAAEAGVFDLTEVEATLATKLVRRHPHVFGDADVQTASDVNRQWERIKAAERADAGETPATKSALDGISGSLPGLAASLEMQERAAHIGYDWPSLDGVLDKVLEETEELRDADASGDRAHWAEEFGDLLFVLVNVARKQGVDAEAAMRAANAKFKRRFASVERAAAAQGVALRDLDFAALDVLWDQAKEEERATP